jgi:hypothetical protein
MLLSEARELVLALIARDLAVTGANVVIDAQQCDPNDPGKFRIDGSPARPIYQRDGWYVPINRAWFAGSLEPPAINDGWFYWYVLAVGPTARRPPHYLICDFKQMREWVLDFHAPKGDDHRDHKPWRAGLRLLPGLTNQAYFRWGDEDQNDFTKANRVVVLDNIATLPDLRACPALPVGSFGCGGESEAHRRLKLYVAARPALLGLSAVAIADPEHSFCTGDRVDILFNNHRPDRTVVEIEVAGEGPVRTGVHQAIKYRSLAEAAEGYPLLSTRVGAHVVAYETDYQSVRDLAARYEVRLLSVDQRRVLEEAV